MPDEQFWIERARKSPYNSRPPCDSAELAAQAVLAGLCDRRGVKQELIDLDGDVKEEIVTTLAAIIRAAYLP
jgi:hypothetical protein